MKASVPKWLLVRLPSGKMVICQGGESFCYPQDGVYCMPDKTLGKIVLTLDDAAEPGYGLLHDLHGLIVSIGPEKTDDALNALGAVLRVVIARTEEAERGKWMEEKAILLKEKAQILEGYNATLKRNVKNLSRCVDVILDLRAENEKLKRKHWKATARIRSVVEAFRAIGMDVKFVVDDGAEVPATPSEQPNPQSVPPATGETNAPPNPDPRSVETEK